MARLPAETAGQQQQEAKEHQGRAPGEGFSDDFFLFYFSETTGPPPPHRRRGFQPMAEPRPVDSCILPLPRVASRRVLKEEDSEVLMISRKGRGKRESSRRNFHFPYLFSFFSLPLSFHRPLLSFFFFLDASLAPSITARSMRHCLFCCRRRMTKPHALLRLCLSTDNNINKRGAPSSRLALFLCPLFPRGFCWRHRHLAPPPRSAQKLPPAAAAGARRRCCPRPLSIYLFEKQSAFKEKKSGPESTRIYNKSGVVLNKTLREFFFDLL